MLRVAGLDQYLARQVRASGASGDLLQLSKGPLARPIVAREQAAVGVEHAGKRQALEMVSLGENLRADEDIGVRRALEQLFEPVPRAHRVAIHAQDARPRKFFPEHKLDPLRPASKC